MWKQGNKGKYKTTLKLFPSTDSGTGAFDDLGRPSTGDNASSTAVSRSLLFVTECQSIFLTADKTQPF